MAGIRQAVSRWARSRYTRMLEAEVMRLRAENRALLNSILGIAGIPPIAVEAPDDAAAESPKRVGDVPPRSGLDSTGLERLANHGPRSAGRTRSAGSVLAGSFRRRSWYQISRALEIDSARKKEREAADAPPIGIAVKNP